MNFQEKTSKKILVIGAGTMGRGIAQWIAQLEDHNVQLSDSNDSILNQAFDNIHLSWDNLKKKGKFSTEKIQVFKQQLNLMNLDNLDHDYDLIIEAIVENIGIKEKLFQDLDTKMNQETIFASNTSSLSISSLAKSLSPERRRQFLGIHFFNPAPIMKLVEVIKGHWTGEDIQNQIIDWLKLNNKIIARCQDSPGFIVNRVARNFYGESLKIVNAFDRKKIEATDTIIKNLGGFKMGPFELMDLIGIDINFQVTNSVWQDYFFNPRFTPHQLQKRMVDSGLLGKKTNEGFYQYES